MKVKPQKRTPRPFVERPIVLVLHEKHGNQYFYIPDEEALFRAALEVLTSRNKENYFYFKPEIPNPELTKEQVDSLPPALKKEGEKKYLARKELILRQKYEAEEYESIQSTIKEKDGRKAWRILRDRNGGEYERVSLERLLKPGEY